MYSGFQGHLQWGAREPDPMQGLEKDARTKEVTRRLRGLAALVKDLGSIPNNHMAAHNHF